MLENVINSQIYIWSPADFCRSHDLVCQSDKKEKSTSRQRNWVEFILEAKLLDRQLLQCLMQSKSASKSVYAEANLQVVYK